MAKSIIQPEKGCCFLCGRYGNLEEHHIFFEAKNRPLSEKYGLKVYLCHICHRDNKEGVHGNREKADFLRRVGQQAFERTHTREEFMRIFGKNRL